MAGLLKRVVCVSRVAWLVVALGLCVSAPRMASADDALNAKIEAARPQLHPLTSDDLAAANQQLRAALIRLDALLVANGEEIRAGWRAYLRWDELEAQLTAPTPDNAVLARIHDSMRRKYASLELPSFMNLRKELGEFLAVSVMVSTEDQLKIYGSLLDLIAKTYDEAQGDPSPEKLSLLGRSIDRLAGAGQAPEVVAYVRHRYSHANVVARVSGAFIEGNSEQPVDDTRPVSEMILGTHQRGTAQTVGTVIIRPVPNSERAEFEAVLLGTTTGANRGTRPLGRNTLVITSTSVSSVEAYKPLYLAPEGLQTCPADAYACTRTSICSICAPPLLSRMVTKQVYKSKPEAEAIAAGRLASRTEESFDERVETALAENRANMQTEVRAPLLQLDAAPQSWRSWTTCDAMMAELIQANSEQLASSTAAPELDSTADVAMALHQTAVNNLAEAVFGGKKITDRQVAEWVEIGSGDLPRELRISQNDRWSITFDAYQPITVEFGDSVMTVRLRGRKFERGVELVEDLIQISATYGVERTEQGVRLTRQGDVEVTFPGREQLNIERRGIRQFMQEKFQALFPEVRETEGIRFPGKFAERAPLHLAQFQMQAGWLSLSWKQE